MPSAMGPDGARRAAYTIQGLARHCDPRITMNVYARALPERLTKIVETVGQPILEDRRTIQA